jgi:hypothetical protein
MAGTVGAMFNCALQLGSAIGLAAVTSIQSSVEKAYGGYYEYYGRAAALWFVLGIFTVQTVGVGVFYRGRSMMDASGSNSMLGGEKLAVAEDPKVVSGDTDMAVAVMHD